MSLLIALVPMIAWGSIGLVSGKIGGSANQQTLGMTIGALLFSIVVFFVIAFMFCNAVLRPGTYFITSLDNILENQIIFFMFFVQFFQV